ncbi:MAG: NAD(P)/FAD-dependent oxidoreductase [Novosphingobium sp.]
MNNRIIVIGAGSAGLSASYYLQKAGFDVLVLEGSDRAGGRVHSIHKDGYILDLGADGNGTGYLTYLDLTREMGLESAISWISGVVGTVVDGKVRYMDPSSTMSLLKTDTYSLRTKLALQKGMKEIAPMLEGIDFRYLYKSAHLDDPNRSAETFGLRHFGPKGTDYLIDPLARLMQATGADTTSILDTAAGLSFANDKLWTFLGGADLLLKTLAQRLNVTYNSVVKSIEEKPDGVAVRYMNANGEEVEETVAACVLSIMYKDAARIHPALKEMSAELAEGLDYMCTSKVHLGYDVRTATRAWTIQVPTVEDPDVFIFFLDHNKAPDRAPAGHSLINVQTDSKFYPRAAAMSDEEAVEFARSKVEKFFPELRGHFTGMSNVTRWPHIGHLNKPGYYRSAAKFINRLDEDSRIQIAGDMFSKASQETSANRGRDVAQNIIRMWQR